MRARHRPVRSTARATGHPLLRTAALGTGLALAAGACFRDADPIAIDDRAVAVHAILEAGADSAVVLVARPDLPSDPLPPDLRPVRGAVVRLIHGSDTTWLVEDPARPCIAPPVVADHSGDGCYRARLAARIAAAETYGLEIELPDGERITGSTRVPAPPDVERPAAGARIPTACGSADACFGQSVQGPPFVLPVARFQVTWQPAPDAGRSIVTVESREAWLNGVAYPAGSCALGSVHAFGAIAEDSVDWRVPNIVCEQEALAPARFDSVAANVAVTSLDPGYARYLDAVLDGSSVRASSVREGLTGAFGVFGAAAATSRRIVLVRDPPAAAARGAEQAPDPRPTRNAAPVAPG